MSEYYTYRIPGQPEPVAVNTEENSIIRLLIDSFVHKGCMGPNRVICIPCGGRVNFTKRFALGEWEAHKRGCKEYLKMKFRDGAKLALREPEVSWTDADHEWTRHDVAAKIGMFSPRMGLLKAIVQHELSKPVPSMCPMVRY